MVMFGGGEAVDKIVSIVAAPSKRDKQHHVGPSELGEVCDRCLADKIRGTYKDAREGAPLAPLLGTAFHLLAAERLSTSPSGRAGALLVEHTVDVVEVPDYGAIRGTVDVFDTESGDVMDWKVLSKSRMAGLSSVVHLRLDGSVILDRKKSIWETAWKYYAQQMLYCRALERDGYEVKRAHLVMLPRDASTDVLPGCVRTITFPYRPQVAQAVLERFGDMVQRVRAEEKRGGEAEYESSPGCYRCSRMKKEGAEMARMTEMWGM